MSEGFIIDTPEGIQHYRFVAVIHALHVEVKTGMKMTRYSLLDVCRQFGVNERTKKKALEAMKILYKQTYGHDYGTTP